MALQTDDVSKSQRSHVYASNSSLRVERDKSPETSLRERFSEAADKLRTLAADDADKLIADLVARGTGDDLIATDWGVNMSIVDTVNQSANPSLMYEKLCKALRRCISRNNAKCQMLSLTILETCVKNCYPALYAVLAHSDLWLDLMKMAADRSVGRIDDEVRDKILLMSEDYAKVLPLPEFREAYELLLERGVDFPVRGPDEQPPVLNPPPGPMQPPGSAHGHAAVAQAGYLGPPAPEARQQLQPEADPFAGMSEEDKQAVRAAMAEMDQEEQAVRESTAQAASAAMFQQIGQQQQQQQRGQQPEQQQEQAEGVGFHYPPPVALAAPAPPPPVQADPGPVLPENVEEALQVISNTTELLNELLASEADPRELFVSELAEQCVKMRSMLEEKINSLADELQLASALAHHEALQAAVCKYDEHLAKAVQGSGVAPPAAGLLQRPTEQPLQGVSSTLLPPEATAAGSNFTLLGEGEEDDDQEDMLSSSRAKGIMQAAEVPKSVPMVPVVSADAGPDLIDVGDVHLQGGEQLEALLPLPEEGKGEEQKAVSHP